MISTIVPSDIFREFLFFFLQVGNLSGLSIQLKARGKNAKRCISSQLKNLGFVIALSLFNSFTVT